MDTLPSSGIVSLQSKIREYLTLLNVLKRQRNEVKTLNQKLKALSDDILETMKEHHIPTCSSQGFVFSLKNKTKMKAATAKTFLVQVKDFFRINDEDMASFVDMVNARRRADAESITALECKPLKASADVEPPAVATLSTAIDDMYD